MDYKSHTYAEIQEAFDAGMDVYFLETGVDGEDDILFGPVDDIVTDLEYHFERPMRPHWTLTQISREQWDDEGP